MKWGTFYVCRERSPKMPTTSQVPPNAVDEGGVGLCEYSQHMTRRRRVQLQLPTLFKNHLVCESFNCSKPATENHSLTAAHSMGNF